MAFALQARFVFPVDRPPIANGVVTIDGERIVGVGAATDAGEIIDLGEVALFPGFVNCHTHLEFSNLKSPLGSPGMPFVDWIRLVISQRGHEKAPAGGLMDRGANESLCAGVTTIGDIVQTNGLAQIDNKVTRGLATPLLEVIGFSRSRAESAFAATIERLDELTNRTRTPIGISPHAPYSVSPSLFRRLMSLAKERDLLVATHLAESNEELGFLRGEGGPFQELLEERSMWDPKAISQGTRPMDYLRMLAEAPRALVIHGNYLDQNERSFLAANADRMSIVYCPRTHSYFGHEPYPLREMLANRVRVALGTDSRASNPDLSLLTEMRFVAKAFPSIDPQVVVRLGTLSGAEALGRVDEVGSISPGKWANLVALPLAANGPRDATEALTSLLEGDSRPTEVWYRGTAILKTSAPTS